MFYKNEGYIYWKDQNELQEARYNPVIIHMCGVKPWNYKCNHPYTEDWFKILDRTPWRGYKSTPPSIKRQIIDGTKRFLSKRINFNTGDVEFLPKSEK